MHHDEPAAGDISGSDVSAIPSKRYFTISEVSTISDVKPHVLRYWEQEFTALRPSKRRGNRRYYRREDVLLVLQIKSLLYDQGYTIAGARLQLPLAKGRSIPQPVEVLKPAEPMHALLENESKADSDVTKQLIQELQGVLKILS